MSPARVHRYLIIAGIIGVLGNVGPLVRVSGFAALMPGVNITLSACYIVLGARFRVMLATAPAVVFRLFHITIAWAVVCVCLAYLVGDKTRVASDAFLGGLLASYLLLRLRRVVATSVIAADTR